MTEENMESYLILRELDEPISRDGLEAAAEKSGETLAELREEGVAIRWVESEVLTTEADRIVGTFCHYRAEDEDAVYEHAERADLPATKVTKRGESLSGE
ncbi:DUF4242 domain-containing protein [Halegenticoccus tardaugens]|uniref:DUF4242 domain-containing protein n=1 Tax=Halegenticoccus tardaugens TaxID=2071624 RepID=UPI00100AF803|nr:DUF4242 domain-containing protein [Halegenticoccus tardaugens]